MLHGNARIFSASVGEAGIGVARGPLSLCVVLIPFKIVRSPQNARRLLASIRKLGQDNGTAPMPRA